MVLGLDFLHLEARMADGFRGDSQAVVLFQGGVQAVGRHIVALARSWLAYHRARSCYRDFRSAGTGTVEVAVAFESDPKH